MDKKTLFVLALIILTAIKLQTVFAQTGDEIPDDFDEEFRRGLARLEAELNATFAGMDFQELMDIEAELAKLNETADNYTEILLQELIDSYMAGIPNATLVTTTTTTLPEVTTTLTGVRRTTTTVAGVTAMPTSTSTVPVVCGGNPRICNVEFDSTGEGEFECCTKDNNPACLKCLDYCKSICDKRGEGVHSCFGEEPTGFGCECSDKPPTCYQQTVATSTTTPMETGPGGSIMFTILIVVVLLLLIAGIVFFVRSL